MGKLQYGVVKAAAEASGYHRVWVSRVVNGRASWRKCKPVLIRALVLHGWEPPEGREFLNKWTKLMAVPIAPVQETPPQPQEATPVQIYGENAYEDAAAAEQQHQTTVAEVTAEQHYSDMAIMAADRESNLSPLDADHPEEVPPSEPQI